MYKTPLARRVALSTLGAALAIPAAEAAFLEDSKATLKMRNFYINQDTRNQDGPKAEEWGQGFILDYQSGFTEGPVGFGLDLTGQYAVRLDAGGREGKAGAEREPGSVFPLESNGKARRDFSRLGATAKMRYSKTVAQVGTLMPKLPVVNYGDGRLLPQMFQGAQVTSKEIKNLTLIAGKIEHSTERNSSNSDGLSIAGAGGPDEGRASNKLYYAGADYKVTDDLLLQYYYGNLRDFYTQHFVGLVHDWALPVGSLQTDLRYFESNSDGENSHSSGRADGYVGSGYWGAGSSHKGEVDSHLWSAQFTYALAGHELSAGYQKVNGSSDHPYINQGNGSSPYLLTNAQLGKFVNAGESTWVASYAYDFAKAGLPGLKAGVTYYSGDSIDAAGNDHKEWERDFRLDYAVQSGLFKGVGFTWRSAMARGNDARDRDENRLIVNYSIPLL
ncbi:OprD family porin [Azotobacter beijerinckii]|uniref:Outer membrane porin, OprD family n=2 Tax=Azotobacter beijerinckii TaxID=170623 RepID=A0A1I4FRX0_9GAMM|nr:OprD family porin [Azotobacter beijerinckii]SFB59860.1 outer membrane porin, OprD family [Azotobacter beijerinckii]SFL20149.1 outer membrane porin, OprD family [Azotobacter beijerinckii]